MQELDLSSVDDEILQSHLESTLMYQPDNPESIRKTIIDALVHIRNSMDSQPNSV